MGQDVAHFDVRTLFAPVAHEKIIGLAVSGGADSLGLMLLVHQWHQLCDVNAQIVIYSVDHRLRTESADECHMVAGLAANMGFESRTLIWGGKKPETGVQAAARVARYQLLAEAMKTDGVQVLLTGHHKQDQSETILMRLAHSSGISGLTGMREFSLVEGVKLFRPLLDISRESLMALVAEAGYIPADDPSNGHEKYERVRWRKMLPQLETLGISQDVLARFSMRMGRANAALCEIAENIFARNVKIDQFGVYSFSLDLLEAQPEEISIRIIEHLIRCASGRNGAELAQLEKLYSEVLTPGFSGCVLAGCKLEIWQQNLVAFREVSKISHGLISLNGGEKAVWDQRFVIKNMGLSRLEIFPALSLTRSEFEAFAQDGTWAKMSAICAAPSIRDSGGDLLVLGEISKISDISCQLLKCETGTTKLGQD